MPTEHAGPNRPGARPAFEQLAQHTDGLLCLTGGKLSALNALLAQG